MFACSGEPGLVLQMCRGLQLQAALLICGMPCCVQLRKRLRILTVQLLNGWCRVSFQTFTTPASFPSLTIQLAGFSNYCSVEDDPEAVPVIEKFISTGYVKGSAFP